MLIMHVGTGFNIWNNMCHLDNLKVAKQPLPLPGMCIHSVCCMCVLPKRYCAQLHNVHNCIMCTLLFYPCRRS